MSSSVLFDPVGNVGDISANFQLTVGGQLTLKAVGFDESDPDNYIWVELVVINRFKPADPCCPGPVNLPSVVASVPLRCCGELIRLDANNPYVIIDAPQDSLLRARLEGDTVPMAWISETKTPDLNDRLRGCECNGS